MTLDEQHEILAKRHYLIGERAKAAAQLATWEKNAATARNLVEHLDERIAELEARFAAGVRG